MWQTFVFLFCIVAALPARASLRLEPIPKTLSYKFRADTHKLEDVRNRVVNLAARMGLMNSPGFAQSKGFDVLAVSEDGNKFFMMLYGVTIDPHFKDKLLVVKNTWIYH